MKYKDVMDCIIDLKSLHNDINIYEYVNNRFGNCYQVIYNDERLHFRISFELEKNGGYLVECYVNKKRIGSYFKEESVIDRLVTNNIKEFKTKIIDLIKI